MVPKELVWKLYFELAQSEYRSGSMVPTFDQLTRHCTAGCTALRPRVAAQLPLLRSDRSIDRLATCAHLRLRCSAKRPSRRPSCLARRVCGGRHAPPDRSNPRALKRGGAYAAKHGILWW